MARAAKEAVDEHGDERCVEAKFGRKPRHGGEGHPLGDCHDAHCEPCHQVVLQNMKG